MMPSNDEKLDALEAVQNGGQPSNDVLDEVEGAFDVLGVLEAVENECPQPGEFSWDIKSTNTGLLVAGAEEEEAKAIAILSKHAFTMVVQIRAARGVTTLVGDAELDSLERSLASLKQLAARVDTGTGRVTVTYEATEPDAVHVAEQMKTLLVELKRLRIVERQLRGQLGASVG